MRGQGKGSISALARCLQATSVGNAERGVRFKGKENNLLLCQDCEVLVDEKLYMTWQCALASQKAKCALSVPKGVTSRSRERIVPGETPHAMLHPSLGTTIRRMWTC